MVTSLLGRRLHNGGVIVAVFVDRGELWVTVESPDSYLYTVNTNGFHLVPEQELEAN